MACRAPKPGHEALMSCEEQVLISTKNHLKVVVMHLRKEKILNEKDCQDVTDTMSLMPMNRRVQFVFDQLASMVDQNNNHFITFLNILYSHTNSEETVERLVHVYLEKGGNIKDVRNLLSGTRLLKILNSLTSSTGLVTGETTRQPPPPPPPLMSYQVSGARAHVDTM